VTFTTVEPAPSAKVEPPKPPPKVEPPEPPPGARSERKKAAPKEPNPVQQPAVLDVPPKPAPELLTGTTLLSDQGVAFRAPTGNGADRVRAIGSGTTQKIVATVPAPKPKLVEPEAVPLAALSEKPRPPPLDRVLERHYPPRARSLGQDGEAKVRARVEASGRVRVANVTFESGRGFGSACRAALLESRWTPPLDGQGKPAATWVSYRCKFRVE
jgi:TonB family protein